MEKAEVKGMSFVSVTFVVMLTTPRLVTLIPKISLGYVPAKLRSPAEAVRLVAIVITLPRLPVRLVKAPLQTLEAESLGALTMPHINLFVTT